MPQPPHYNSQPYRGKLGRVTQVYPKYDADTGCVGRWLLYCPKHESVFKHWMMVVGDITEAEIRPPDMFGKGKPPTHEWMMMALHPESLPSLRDVTSWHPVHPVIYAALVRFTPGDYNVTDSAILLGEQMARRAVEGFYNLNPYPMDDDQAEVLTLLEGLAHPYEARLIDAY